MKDAYRRFLSRWGIHCVREYAYVTDILDALIA